jgi:hypothetical protein
MDATAKQQVVERVKQASNILVTVSKDPSVDQLAACIGLTLFLNKIGKHTTAVFSGAVPSTIDFLQPEKTISVNTDNLRDFIISLDKEKADKLRYKVEDNFVRIYITPYKTSLTEKDLQFSQGEVNVDMIIALGVTDQTQLDDALVAHGKILHNATVVSVSAKAGKAQLGQISWQEPNSSSLSEMIVSISEAFGSNLLDGQMATAFLTGIVASTDRFANEKTSPKVMTMAAQLMASGANQQLIINELKPDLPPPPPPQAPKAPEPKPEPPKRSKKDAQTKPEQVLIPEKDKNTLSVKHGSSDDSEQEVEITNNEINIDTEGNLLTAAKEAEAAAESAEVLPPPPEDIPVEPAPAPVEVLPLPLPTPEIAPEPPPTEPAPAPKIQAKPTPLPPPGPAEAGGHHLMSVAPPGGSQFPGMTDLAPAEPSAPDINEEVPITGDLNGRSDPVTPPAEEQARSAVEQAYQSGGEPQLASFEPPTAAPPPQVENPAAPPPFPPPITLNQGVVIPPPYDQSNGNDESI